MDAQAFLLQLESNTLPAAEFNHRAHLLAAWSYRQFYPAREAAARCARALSRYAMAQGAAEKYHHTLTMASLTLVYDRLDAMPECLDNWQDFVASNPDLLALKGQAQGASLAIADHTGALIKLGSASPAQTLSNGNTYLQFNAYLQGDKAVGQGAAPEIVPGDFETFANFTLAYQ